jgi:HD superfamily phosphodiesterase
MEQIIAKAESHVVSLLNDRLPTSYIYHNVYHTIRVVKNLKILIEQENLNKEESIIVELAGWFHDTGFIEDTINHEDHSAQIAERFLLDQGAEKQLIEEVKSCILATKMDVVPQTKLEMIMKDARFFSLPFCHFSWAYFV